MRLTSPFHAYAPGAAAAQADRCTLCSSEALVQQKRGRLLGVAALVLGFAGVELGMAAWSHSVALMADAGHLGADCLAVLVALGAASWGDRLLTPAKANPFASASFTTQVLAPQTVEASAALINGLILGAIALGILGEANQSLRHPADTILGMPMLLTAGLGLVVNAINIRLLHHHSHDDLNIRGVLLHVLADAASSLGVLVAAVAIALKGWDWVDGAVGVLVGSLSLVSAIPLIAESSRRLYTLNVTR